GLTDVLPIFATVDRDDLHVVAADYPLLKALTGVNRHFIVVRENAGPRRQALHEVTAHLKNGEAVLILAAGKIEPDPAVSTRDRASRTCCRSSQPSIATTFTSLRPTIRS